MTVRVTCEQHEWAQEWRGAALPWMRSCPKSTPCFLFAGRALLVLRFVGLRGCFAPFACAFFPSSALGAYDSRLLPECMHIPFWDPHACALLLHVHLCT